jgi:hypothetical protein
MILTHLEDYEAKNNKVNYAPWLLLLLSISYPRTSSSLPPVEVYVRYLCPVRERWSL